MINKITVLTAKTGANGTYRAIRDELGLDYLCFNKKLWHYLEPGQFFYAEYEEAVPRKDGKGTYNRLINISTEEPKPPQNTGEQVKVPEQPAVDPKNRSYALSYAKDLAVAGKIEVSNIRGWAEKFAKYLDTGE